MSEFDFSKVVKPSTSIKDPDFANPVKFFYKLSHPEITDPRPPQDDILNRWFNAYNTGQNDNVISLNTGAGKTLVGIYIAESIRRSTGGKVLYVCPNNLLGKQTVDEAKKYGLQVASYLNLSGDGVRWTNEDEYLSNEMICVTNYHAVFNSKSIFSSHELRGVIFDDAHIALESLDQQYRVSVDNEELIREIATVFNQSSTIEHKIKSIIEGDPQSMVMIPPLEWIEFNDVIREKLLKAKIEETDSFGWTNIREVFSKSLCFISPKRIEISLLYPNIQDHFLFKKDVHRVYLSATVPNLGDIVRVFGVTPTRIQSNKIDYRPERLFLFPRKTAIKQADDIVQKNLTKLTTKALVLVPSNYKLQVYAKQGISIPTNPKEVMEQTSNFKLGKSNILCLASRYDGIDLPGNICNTLVIDGLPNSGDLKTRFFSEYFHNGKNSFLRSIIASKLVQAFGRTVRSSDDYSVIFLLGEKLYRWIANKDNERFFKPDLLEDLDIGLRVSSGVTSLENLTNLTKLVFDRDDKWKVYIESERKVEIPEGIVPNLEDEDSDVAVAKIEREIINDYLQNNYGDCIQKIIDNQDEIGRYSKPMLGLYLSLASVCASILKDDRIHELSSQAYGINQVFGRSVLDKREKRSIQVQKILDFKGVIPNFSIKMSEPQFNEAIKNLGLALGYDSYRPDTEGEGTLDACWYDQEYKVVLGLENKTEKENKTLFKKEIDQCSGHSNYLSDEYSGFEKKVYAIGEFELYDQVASPRDLLHVTPELLKKIELLVKELYKHRENPIALEKKVDELKLRIIDIFPINKVLDLKSIRI
jgi:hypothetical protein